MAALKSYLSASIEEAAWPSDLGAGVVIRRSRVQGLHPVTSGIGFSAELTSNPRSRIPTGLPPASWDF